MNIKNRSGIVLFYYPRFLAAMCILLPLHYCWASSEAFWWINNMLCRQNGWYLPLFPRRLQTLSHINKNFTAVWSTIGIVYVWVEVDSSIRFDANSFGQIMWWTKYQSNDSTICVHHLIRAKKEGQCHYNMVNNTCHILTYKSCPGYSNLGTCTRGSRALAL